MAKKPSLTKQIADHLGTENKQEQFDIIQRLTKIASQPPLAVTVLLTPAGIDIQYVSPVQITPDQLKSVLQAGVDEVTKAVLKAEMEQQARDAEKDVKEKLQEYADENPDKQVFDGDHNPVPPSK